MGRTQEFGSLNERSALIRFAAILLWVGILVSASLHCAVAQDVLVYRPIDNSDVVVTNPEIVFELEITSFNEIQKVTVNGDAQPITPDTFATVRIPITLKLGSNRFVVAVKTDAGEVEQEFEIRLLLPELQEPIKKKKSNRFK